MDWRLAGQEQSIVVEFTVDGNPVVPDADSIMFMVLNNAGEIIVQEDFVQQEDSVPTQAIIVVDANDNTLATGALFEARYVRVDFKYNSTPYFVQKSYRLQNMVLTTVTPQDVRGTVGADFEEMRDSEIDIMEAYVQLVSAVGSGFSAALIATDVTCLAANRAIALQAAIKFCTSFPTRLLKSEKFDNAGAQRFDVNFKMLEVDLRAELETNLNVINGVTSVTLPTFFVVTKQTDRITNTDT